MAATLTATDLELSPGRRTDVSFVRPDVDCVAGLTVTLAGKPRLDDSPTSYSTTTLQASGDMAIRASGRYLRPTLAIAAGTDWNHVRGLTIVGAAGAGR
jgi:hypothetical protein